MTKKTCLFLGGILFMINISNYANPSNNKSGDPINNTAGKIQVGVTLVLGGNQELGVKLFSSCAGIVHHKFAGLEGGLRIGINLYQSYKSDHYVKEIDATWFLGVVIGEADKSNNQLLPQDEFKFAGSGIPSNITGIGWGVGGVGILTSSYKATNISNYLGTQYLKFSVHNISLILNHTNDAMMKGFWLKKALPPILGFLNTDWHRTTELSATLNIANDNNVVAAFCRISLFTPKVFIDPVSHIRMEVQTGNTNPAGNPQMRYVLDPASHGTFFSFTQIGVTGKWGSHTGNLNYSCGNPQPLVQNNFAHDNGYRFPLFIPAPGMSSNQSRHSLGGSYIFSNLTN